MNQSGTDDITVRLNVLLLMAVLVGYSANASAIHIGSSATSEVSSRVEYAAEVLSRRIADDDVSAFASDKALVAAVAFFIVGRGSRVPLQVFYAWRLPRFAKSFISQALLHAMIIAICLPLLWVSRTRTIIILAVFAMAMDFVGRFIPMALVLFKRDVIFAKIRNRPDLLEKARSKWKNWDGNLDVERLYFSRVHVPAINIEHHIERTVSFVIIVFGELVISVVYHATTATVGLSLVYGRAVLGLVMAFNLAWIYWDVEASGTFVHALRRHWFASIAWNQLHWPLCGSLILASAALARLVLLDEAVSPGHRWYFGGGFGCAMIMLALIGAVHRSLEPRGLTRLSRAIMLSIRAIVGIVMCCMPLVDPNDLSATSFLAVTAGLTTFVVIEETYGKLHNFASSDLESDTQTVVEQGDIVEVEVENAELVELPQDMNDERDLDGIIAEAEDERGEDLRCSTWREWVQMEKARKERARAEARARAEGRALAKLTRINKRLRQWQHYQAECRRVNPMAGACAGG